MYYVKDLKFETSSANKKVRSSSLKIISFDYFCSTLSFLNLLLSLCNMSC